MMNIFLAILGEAYTIVRSENQEMLNNQVVTKKKGFMGYLRHVRAVVKAKLKQRRDKKLAARGVPARRAAQLPADADALNSGVEMQSAGGGGGDAEGGRRVTFSDTRQPFK